MIFCQYISTNSEDLPEISFITPERAEADIFDPHLGTKRPDQQPPLRRRRPSPHGQPPPLPPNPPGTPTIASRTFFIALRLFCAR